MEEDAERERLDEIEREIEQARERAQHDHLLPDGKHHPGMFDDGPDATDAPAPG